MSRTREATDSVFRVQPKNILGLGAQSFKSKLLALALSEPACYFELRDKVYQTIVEKAVEDAYNLYWDILTIGKSGATQIGVNKKDGSAFPFVTRIRSQYICIRSC